MSIQAWLIRRKIRSAFRPKSLATASKEQKQQRFEAALTAVEQRLPRPPKDTRIDTVDQDGVKGEWVAAPDARADRILFFSHGGGYMWGGPKQYRELGWRLSKALGARVFLLDYRLAPGAVCPAPIEDALRAYDWIVNANPGAAILMAGDSAGGGLTLATAHEIRDSGRMKPKALALISPWLDVSCSGESMRTMADKDVMIDPAGIRHAGVIYAKDMKTDDPRCSPLFGDQSGLPPVMVQVGSEEVLLDDSRLFAERAKGAGVSVELQVWNKMHHVWHFSAMIVPEGRKAIADIARFVAPHWGN